MTLIHVYIGSLQASLSIQSVTGWGLSRKKEGCITTQKEASLPLHNQNSLEALFSPVTISR